MGGTFFSIFILFPPSFSMKEKLIKEGGRVNILIWWFCIPRWMIIIYWFYLYLWIKWILIISHVFVPVVNPSHLDNLIFDHFHLNGTFTEVRMVNPAIYCLHISKKSLLLDSQVYTLETFRLPWWRNMMCNARFKLTTSIGISGITPINLLCLSSLMHTFICSAFFLNPLFHMLLVHRHEN